MATCFTNTKLGLFANESGNIVGAFVMHSEVVDWYLKIVPNCLL